MYDIYKLYHFFAKRKLKIKYVRFALKVIIICSNEKTRFDYKNKFFCDKSTNLWLEIII